MKKVGQLLACLLPTLMFLGINIVVTIIVEVGVIAKYISANGGLGDDYIGFVMGLATDKDFLLKITVTFQIVALIVAAIIYYFGFKEKNIENPGKVFSAPSVVYVIAFFAGCELFVGFLLNMAYYVVPDVMESYQKLIEQSGLGDLSFFSTIATLVMAPLAEELFFRGMTMKLARKFTKEFWLANLIQAFLFGFAHLNLVQGVYAFLLGLVLGLIYKKFNSLYASMLGHLTFNFAGTYLTSWIYGNEENVSNLKLAIIAVGSLIILSVALILISRDSKVKEREALFVARYANDYALANAPAPAEQPVNAYVSPVVNNNVPDAETMDTTDSSDEE